MHRFQDLRLRCRSYLYLHLTDEEEVKATNRDEEASREVGVPLQWSIATEISNGTTFVVRRPACRPGSQSAVARHLAELRACQESSRSQPLLYTCSMPVMHVRACYACAYD